MALIDLTQTRPGAFMTALANAEGGDELLYHIGEWCAGPHKHIALDCAEAGKCILYQRRHDKKRFAYIAKKPKRK